MISWARSGWASWGYFHQRPVTLAVECLLVDFVKTGRGQRPAEEPLGLLDAHIDAAVAHRDAEVIVPVGAVEGMAFFGEETAPGYAGQDIIVNAGGQVGLAHVFGGHFDYDVEIAGRRVGRRAARAGKPGDARGNVGLKNNLVVFITSQGLCIESDLDAFLLQRNVRRNGRDLFG